MPHLIEERSILHLPDHHGEGGEGRGDQITKPLVVAEHNLGPGKRLKGTVCISQNLLWYCIMTVNFKCSQIIEP